MLNRIKEILAEQEINCKWLVELVGNLHAHSKRCGNSVQPDLKTLAQIAKCLNVKVADLIKEPLD